jgi:hypothetical protein
MPGTSSQEKLVREAKRIHKFRRHLRTFLRTSSRRRILICPLMAGHRAIVKNQKTSLVRTGRRIPTHAKRMVRARRNSQKISRVLKVV